MPELPEVTTTVNGLNKTIKGLSFLDIWTDLSFSKNIWQRDERRRKMFKDSLKDPYFFPKFKKLVIGKKVLNVERRAKNILINIFDGYTIIIHLKMTGHLLYGKYIYDKKVNTWKPSDSEKPSLSDPYNRFVHVVFSLSNGKHLAMSDSRKFGKVTIEKTSDLLSTKHIKNIGPEPLLKSFSFQDFKNRLLLKSNSKIKTVLMDQSIIAGIGNIYSDEMLWLSDIHPETSPKNISNKNMHNLYKSMKKVLEKGIDFGGDSMSDYRNIHGEKGKFQHHHNVYRKEGQRCMRRGCHGVIIRKIIGGRSAHFCNVHQKL